MRRWKIWDLSSILFIIGVGSIIWGVFNYYHQQIQKYHYLEAGPVNTANFTGTPSYLLRLQLMTNGPGFFVGKPIEISALLRYYDNESYNYAKSLFKLSENSALVRNAESVEGFNKDISKAIKEIDLKNARIGSGLIYVTTFDDNNHNIVLEGEVVFTQDGIIQFGFPLDILTTRPTDTHFPSIEPSSTKYQIELNKTVLLLTFITIGISSFSLSSSTKAKNEKT